MALQIRIDLVNGTYIPDYSMSIAEFSYRIIGDDHGPPAQAWSLSFTTDDGQVNSLYFDPKDDQSEVQVFPISAKGHDESEFPSYKQDRLKTLAHVKIDQLNELINQLHPTQKKTILARVASSLSAEKSAHTRSFFATRVSRTLRVKRLTKPDLSVIDRVQSRNKKISHTEPIVIHKSRQSIIEVIPLTIKRTMANEYKLKLKSSNPKQPFAETAEITLNGKAIDLLKNGKRSATLLVRKEHAGGNAVNCRHGTRARAAARLGHYRGTLGANTACYACDRRGNGQAHRATRSYH